MSKVMVFSQASLVPSTSDNSCLQSSAFTYDVQGRRIQKKVHAWDPQSSALEPSDSHAVVTMPDALWWIETSGLDYGATPFGLSDI